ncbi:MAG: N-acetyltransferase family protein [Methylophilaceae bacterium]
MSLLRTRLAKQEDIIQIGSLFDQYRQFYSQMPDIALATQYIEQRMQNKESVILVAERNVELIGFCQLYPTFCSVEAAPIMVLYDLFVSPSARKTGAGRALMMVAQEYAKQKGFVRLYLSTAKTNKTAQSLYQSLGWERDEIYLSYNLGLI